MAVKDNGIMANNPPRGTDAWVVVVFISMALYNVAELAFIISATFKRRSGNYFWFFVLATFFIVPYSVGFLCKYLDVLPSWPQSVYVWVSLSFTGWCGMVLFQSLVLWSRLHLVMHSPRRLRAVLWMIIVDAVICDVPVSVLVFGSSSSNPEPFVAAYAAFESVQVTLFALQEFVISAIYIVETAKILRLERESGATFDLPARRRVLTHLICVSVIVILLDLPTLVLQYCDQYAIQTTYKAFAYSVKLKLEFSILNRLIDVTRFRELSVPSSAQPVYSGSRRRVNVAVASSSADRNTSKPRDDPAIPPSHLPRFPRHYGPRGATTVVSGERGLLDSTAVDLEAGFGETAPGIHVAVETEVTVETSEKTNPRNGAKKDGMQQVEDVRGGAREHTSPSRGQGDEGERVEAGANDHSFRCPPPPHPSESLVLPAMLFERGPYASLGNGSTPSLRDDEDT